VSWLEAAVRWYGLLLLLTWGWAPFVRLLCPRLADRGMMLARPLALLGIVYPSWLLASLGLLPYSTLGLWLTLAGGAVVAWGMAGRRGLIERGWLRSLVAAEVVSLATFAAYVWLRGFTPAILNTEKPMDSAFLASSALTATIPPPDPWFAGEPINYYYLGYLLHGALARMSGVVATTGFNLALATTFSLAATAAAGLGYDAARPWLSRGRAEAAGVAGPVLLVLAGNLLAPIRLLQAPAETLAAAWWDGVGWRASRIVCDGPRIEDACRPLGGRIAETINEFPFFSFLLGDLHPHLMALPFTLVALALGLNLLMLRRTGERPGRGDWVRLALTGAVVGALYALNSWDLPTFLLIAATATWIGWGGSVAAGRALRGVLLLGGAAALAWLPFVAGYEPPDGVGGEALRAAVRALPVLPNLLASVGVHTGERTSVGEYLTIFGVPFFFAVWLIGSGLLAARPRSTGGEEGETAGWLAVSRPAVVFALLTLVVAVLLPAPVLVLCGVPLAGAAVLLGRDRAPSPRTIATALFGLGFALSMVVELFYLRDVFDSRMNTLFKVYYQVWTLFAVATALSLVALWREARPRRLARPALALAGTAALAAILAYPVVAAAAWTDGFAGWQGLDGLAYADELAPDEAAAVRWLQGQAAPGDVVLEAVGCAYHPISDLPFNRVSAYTGIPTIFGWRNHESQWRDGQPALRAAFDARERDVRRLFADPRGPLLDRYGVDWLYLGRYETGDWRDECPTAGPYEGIDAAGYPGSGWELAFESGDVRIYRREEPSAGG